MPKKQADKWKQLPDGWTPQSRKKYWDSLVGDVKHPVTKCIEKMEGNMDDPGAFCASLADRVKGNTNWRGDANKKPKKASNAVISIPPNPTIDGIAKMISNPLLLGSSVELGKLIVLDPQNILNSSLASEIHEAVFNELLLDSKEDWLRTDESAFSSKERWIYQNLLQHTLSLSIKRLKQMNGWLVSVNPSIFSLKEKARDLANKSDKFAKLQKKVAKKYLDE